MLADFFKLALNNLRRRKLRSWLTMLGIFIGIAAVVALVSLGQGLQTAITAQFATLSTDKLTIQNAGTGFGPPGSTVVEKLNDHDVSIIENVRGVEEVVPRLVRVVRVEFNDVVNFNYIGDIPEESEKMDIVYNALNVGVSEGRLLRDDDHGKIVIGSNIAKKSTFNKKISVGKKIKIKEEEFEVIGILKRGSSFQTNDVIIMLNDDMEEILEIDDEIDMIIVQVENPDEIKELAMRLEKAMRRDRDLDVGEEDFSVQIPLEAVDAVNDVLIAVNAVVIGIALISLIVGGIGIANTMYTSVVERRREIGTMKAIGAKNSDILSIFIIESALMGFVGGLIGGLIGAGLAITAASSANGFFGTRIIAVDISIPFVVSMIIFSSLIGIFSGLIPSYQASKLKPVDALRS
jgi:putative ABC transport system permease protein